MVASDAMEALEGWFPQGFRVEIEERLVSAGGAEEACRQPCGAAMTPIAARWWALMVPLDGGPIARRAREEYMPCQTR
jgi:hypothetical protein